MKRGETIYGMHTVRVIVTAVNPIENLIDLALAEDE